MRGEMRLPEQNWKRSGAPPSLASLYRQHPNIVVAYSGNIVCDI